MHTASNLVRNRLASALLALSLCVSATLLANTKAKEPAPRFNAKSTSGESTNLAAMYAATAYPVYVVIDREGNIAGTQRGAAGEDALRSLLAKAGLGSDPDADSE